MAPDDDVRPERLSLERVEMITAKVGTYLHKNRPPGWRYLLIFATESTPDGKDGHLTYSSDIAREYVGPMLEEFIQRLYAGDYTDTDSIGSKELEELMRSPDPYEEQDEEEEDEL